MSTSTTTEWLLPTGLLKPLSMNDRMHYMAKARITRAIRRHVTASARAERIPAFPHIHVRLEYTPRQKRRRDTDSLWLTGKPAIDALVDARVVPDDTSEFVTRHEPLIRPCDPRLRGSRLLLRVWVEHRAVTP